MKMELSVQILNCIKKESAHRKDPSCLKTTPTNLPFSKLKLEQEESQLFYPQKPRWYRHPLILSHIQSLLREAFCVGGAQRKATGDLESKPFFFFLKASLEEIKNRISSPPRNLSTKVEGGKQFYYWVSIKPECDVSHRLSTEEIPKTERNTFSVQLSG